MRRATLIAFTTLAATALAVAAPPELVEKGPVAAPLREPTFFSVKADPKKKLQLAKTFDTKVFSVVRLWSDDPAVYDFQVFPKADGTFYVGFFQDGETPLVVEVKAGDGTTPPTPPGPPIDPVDPARKGVSYQIVYVEDSDAAAGSRKGALLTNKALDARMKEKGHSWRIVTKDNTAADVQDEIKGSVGKGYPQIFLNDKAGKLKQLQFPAGSADDLIKLLDKYGG